MFSVFVQDYSTVSNMTTPYLHSLPISEINAIVTEILLKPPCMKDFISPQIQSASH